MGLDFSKFEWTPNTIGKNWMSVCNFYGNMMPFFGQTLWQVGPMPFITQGWFPNANYGNWGDQFVPSYTPGAGGGGGSTNLTESEKATLKTQKKEIIDYNKKYNAMLDALTEYKETLRGDAKVDFETELSIAKINLSSKRNTSAPSSNNLTAIENLHKQAEKAYEELLKIYKEYNEAGAVSEAYEESLKIKTTEANNKNYESTVDDLSTWINNPTEKFVILDKNSDGTCKWDNNIDVMELLSTWNSTHNNTSRLIETIVTKHDNLENTTIKAYLVTFTEKLCNELRKRANGIKENELTNSTKNLLKDAKKAFPGSINSNDLNSDLISEFNELYKAVRLAEAEIADKELAEAFDFLGDENPYKNNNNNNKLFNDAKADLKKEGINVDGVTTPTVNTPAAPTPGGNENPVPQAVNKDVWDDVEIIFIVGENEYKITIQFGENDEVKFKSGSSTMYEDDLKGLGITDIKLNDDGTYSYKANGKVKKFNKEGQEITDDSNA